MRYKIFGEMKNCDGYTAIIKCDFYEVEKGKHTECMIHCFNNKREENGLTLRDYIGAILCDNFKVEEIQ